jgi:hypothetical protein
VQSGDVQINQYALINDVMQWRMVIAAATTASMGSQLFLRLPDGFRCRDNKFIGFVQWDDGTGAGTEGVGKVFGTQDQGGRRLNIVRDVLPASTAWPNSAGNFGLRFNLTIPVMQE